MSSYKPSIIKIEPYTFGKVSGLCGYSLDKKNTFDMSIKQFSKYCKGHENGIRMRKESMVNKMLEGDSNAWI